MNKFKIISLAFVAVLLAQVSTYGAYTTEQPISQIKATVDQVVLLITDKKLQEPDKYTMKQQRIFALVDKRFDFPLMGRLALGKSWPSVTEAERDQFVKLFSQLLKNSYIRRVDSYAGGQVLFTKQVIKKNLAIVYSYYEQNNGQFSINYKMQKKHNGQWLVFDVEIEGVSVVKLYRKQFQEILKKESMPELNKRINTKVEALQRISKAAHGNS